MSSRDIKYKRGILVNLSDFTFIYFQFNPKNVKKDKQLQYYETPNVGGTDRPLYETGSKSRFLQFDLDFHRHHEPFGVLPEIAFFEKLSYGRNTLTNALLRLLVRNVGSLAGKSTQEGLLTYLDFDLQQYIGDSIIDSTPKGELGIRNLTSLYSRLPTDTKPQVLLLGMGYIVPVVCDLINVSFKESVYKDIPSTYGRDQGFLGINYILQAMLNVSSVGTDFDRPTQLEVQLKLSEDEEGFWATYRRIFSELMALEVTMGRSLDLDLDIPQLPQLPEIPSFEGAF